MWYCLYLGDSSKCHGDWLSICLSVEAALLDLVLYMHQQVEAELDKIKNHPDNNKVLFLDVWESEPAMEPEISSAARVFEEARSLGAKVTGKKPHQYPQLNKFGNRANEIYGLANQEQLSRLVEYLHLNGGYELVPVQNRDSCTFAAIRRGVDVPRAYTNTYMRRQIVMFVLQNVQFFFPLKLSIMGNYGHARLSSE